MSRHRHIRSLDAQGEYDDLYEDCIIDDSSSPVTEEIDFATHIREKSTLSDFINLSIPQNLASPRQSVKTKQGCKRASPTKHDRAAKRYTMNKTGNTSFEQDIKIVSDSIEKYEIDTFLPSLQLSTTTKKVTEELVTFNSLSESSLCSDDCLSRKDSASATLNAQDTSKIGAYHSRSNNSKPLVNVVVIGHVDSGKSTLFGNMLVSLGYVDGKVFHKCKKESELVGKASFLYAWLLDETTEEQHRGITMDVAQRKFETTKHEVVLLDAPGHKDFITNMISGTAGADASVLVLDSTFGEFETGFETGGQTKEHIVLTRSLGISQLIVAVNKMDKINWQKDRFSEIVAKISPFLSSVGFKKPRFVPCSGLLGANVTTKPSSVLEWYNGPTLLDAIDELKSPERQFLKSLRMYISDLYKGSGKVVNISGKISSGSVKVNDRIKIMPLNHSCTVSRIAINSVIVPCGFAGDHVDLQVAGIDHSMLSKGHVLCSEVNPVNVSSRFRSKLLIFDIPTPLVQGYPVVFHQQNQSEPAVITKLISLLQKNSGEVLQRKPRYILGNNCAIVEITVDRPVCIDVYDKTKELGRFLLRSGSCTIAAGTIDQIF